MSSSATLVHAGTTPAETPVWKLGAHIPQLDGVRGWAILIVTLYRFSKEIPTDSWFGQAVHATFGLGDRGVDLFFVLSGFLITGILVDAKGRPNCFSHFLLRRGLRIFPLYFISLLLLMLLTSRVPGYSGMFAEAREHQFYLWTYLSNLKMGLEGDWCFGYLDHFWSLAVEEHFYWIWPLVVLSVSQRTALRIAVAMAVLSAGARIGFAMGSSNGVAPDVLTCFRCDALLIGSALALQIRAPSSLHRLRRWSWCVGLSALAVGVGCALLGKRFWTVPHTAWPLFWASFLVWLLTSSRASWLARSLERPSLRQLGRYSYAMYVFQSPLIPLTAGSLSVAGLGSLLGSPLAAGILYVAGMFSLTYAAGVLSWYLLESHCLRLKRFFPHAHSPVRSQAFSLGSV